MKKSGFSGTTPLVSYKRGEIWRTKKMIEKKQEESKTPEKQFRAGAISATIWKNSGTAKDGKVFEYKTVSLKRSYTDENDVWQSSNSFRTNDLPKAALVLSKSYEYLAMKEKEVIEN